ncbi:MAG: dTDP-4-dehydrorhamnose reductase [bacterium]
MAKLKLLKEKVLVAGANGLLGQKLLQVFSDGFEIHGFGRASRPVVAYDNYHYTMGDITDRNHVKQLVHTLQPAFILNAAAYTNVDGCETDKETCWKVNAAGVEYLAQAAAAVGAFLVHVSTDYVFDGEEGNYDETSKPAPQSYYGRAKLAGENALRASRAEYAIARTMILYGAGKNINPNFATWLVDKLSKNEPVRIVTDQYGHPTLADDLAQTIRKIVELKKTDLFHVVGPDYLSRFDFALKLAELFNFNRDLIAPIKTTDLNQKAPRPLNSRFKLDKLRDVLGVEMHGVEQGLKIFKKQLNELS